MSYMAVLALIKQGDGNSAKQAASEALRLFRIGRQAGMEALATWALRMTALRFGSGGSPDWELVDAAADVPSIAGHVALTEAGFAFHAGDVSACHQLVSAVGTRVHSPDDPISVLADALDTAIGNETVNPTVTAGRAGPLGAQIGLQVLGLLACGVGPRPEWRDRALSWLAELAGRDPDQRLELVSLRQVSAWLVLG